MDDKLPHSRVTTGSDLESNLARQVVTHLKDDCRSRPHRQPRGCFAGFAICLTIFLFLWHQTGLCSLRRPLSTSRAPGPVEKRAREILSKTPFIGKIASLIAPTPGLASYIPVSRRS
ncbi:hypothetical protein SODALDRAFT_31636 [Sodiomyces alkalinus F11]|uniref:Uncharacterized protein n=1 Tax=Sodiomyces alkalinus (strain CBS 110278 / VKM F-3762 / F11) TaxID=1314773 RepID=A0A3N2Q8X0_SODAK|nr:hypothetical protein SODALDRAFT_31636 [Sodiomyces alkalinus F11]ROT43137.1 hypothetical protein SODALDRAFT_31636 [Sodiomyces alkalinus F11]